MIPDRLVRANILTSLRKYASVLPQCPLPTLTMVVRRHVALHSDDAFCAGLCRDLEDFCSRMIEDTCLDDGFRGHGLTTDPPAGADIRYTWGKDRSTLADPRTQARKSTLFTIPAFSSFFIHPPGLIPATLPPPFLSFPLNGRTCSAQGLNPQISKSPLPGTWRL
jgi:hypothetical protein